MLSANFVNLQAMLVGVNLLLAIATAAFIVLFVMKDEVVRTC